MANYHGGNSNEDMISWFITGTCQVIPKTFSPVSDHMHDLVMTSKPASKEYSIMCGSHTEFYIRPLNTCIDDYDILICNTNELAYSGDIPVLPIDMSGLEDTIMCYKIESYQKYPGFVRLRVLGLMKYNWKHKMYELNYTALSGLHIGLKFDMGPVPSTYLEQELGRRLQSAVTGPARKYKIDSNLILGKDTVRSVFCPQWPRQAETWPIRPRNGGWPTMDTISEIVQNGCHVVYIQHRSCRDNKEQWRLSFSFAEIILLQSWSQTQQIIYHLLRFFAKRELIQKDCPKEDEVLCPYHLKTLMLWTCEEMSPEWWNSSSVITICCELLKKLSQWLKKRRCPNYFIPEANLFHEPSSSTILDKIEKRLNVFINSGSLCHWFVENYILPITRTQFQFLNTRKVVGLPDFMDYMMPLLEYRKTGETQSLDVLLSFRFSGYNKICRSIIKYGLSSGLRQNLNFGQYTTNLTSKLHSTMTYLPTTEKVLCFKYFDFLLYILHVAYGLRYGEISWNSNIFVEFVEVISIQSRITRSQYHNVPKPHKEQSRWFQFLRAQDLMQNVTGSNSRSEFQLVSLISKEFLRKALEYDDSKSNGIAPAALIYMAALHFATTEYQLAMRFCLSSLADQTSQMDKETLNARCLLFIDDVARIVGFCVLHKKLVSNNPLCITRQMYLDLRLLPDVFAEYLRALSAERISKHLVFHSDFPESAFPMDEYLRYLYKRKYIVSMKSGNDFNVLRQIVYRRKDTITETESANMNGLKLKETVIDVLMECALENMTSFYSAICKDFGIQCNTIDCYRALHLYKCCQYDQVLHLCERILHEPDLQSDLKQFSFANVLLLPPFDSFYDEDVQSLLGFHTLFYYLSHLSDIIQKLDVTDELLFANCFVKNVFFHNNGLSFFIHDHYSIKCNYFLGRHFLARYLKVRCYIDCYHPYSEAMTEFAAHKTIHPFEHIIRRFLLQKLRFIKKDSSSYQ